tara:strand:+ start:97 stop:1659 length:1563 start_codon:yes stop_codon:yes gene_type:complete
MDVDSNITKKEKNYSYILYLVFAVLILARVVLWLAVEWPDGLGKPAAATPDAVAKVKGLPVWLMIYWMDSGRYWLPLQEILTNGDIRFAAAGLFFKPVLSIQESINFVVVVLNILSLLTAWILSRMLIISGYRFAAVVLFLAFLNLFTISMEYSILREVLARFWLILAMFLVWRVRNSEGRGLVLLTSLVLLSLGFIRQEMMVMPLVMLPVFFSKGMRTKAIVFFLIGIISVIAQNFLLHPGIGIYNKYLQFEENLIIESYNYVSPEIGDLPQRVYKVGKKCESRFKISCQFPSIRQAWFNQERAKVVFQWAKENPNHPTVLKMSKKWPFSKFDVRGGLFLNKILFDDILRNRKVYFLYSTAYSFWSYLTGNVFTISPLVYKGNSPNYILAWPYYSSPSITRFGDPLSEIQLKERGPKWLLNLMSPFSESWYRPICLPFFVVGLFLIARMVLNKTHVSTEEKTFWYLAALICVAGFVIASFVGHRTSRAIFTVDPLMIAISVLGARSCLLSFLSAARGWR